MAKEICALEERITELMKIKSISTKRELAARAGYSEQYLSMVLKGKTKPTARRIARLAHALEITVDYACTLFHLNDKNKIQEVQESYQEATTNFLTRRQFGALYSTICREIAYQYHQNPPEEQRVMIGYLSRVLGKYRHDVIERTHLALDLLDILRENRIPIELNLPIRTTTEIGSALALLQQRIPKDDFGQVLDKTYQKFMVDLNAAFQAGEPAEKIVFLDTLEKVLMQYSKKL